MKKPKTIDELASTTLALRKELGGTEGAIMRYGYAMNSFLRHYASLTGTREYSANRLDETIKSLRAKYEAGGIRIAAFQRYRRVAADLEDAADYGALDHSPQITPWGLPRNQLMRPVPDAIRNDPEDVIGLSLAVLAEMERAGYSAKTTGSYFNCALPRLVEHFRESGTTRYSDELIDSFVEKAATQDVGLKGRALERCRLAALHVRAMHDQGALCLDTRQSDHSVVARARSGPFAALVAEYEVWQEREGMRASTVKVGLNYVGPFLELLCPEGPDGLKGITRERVRSVRMTMSEGRSPRYVKGMLGPIRVFARFMEERHPECPQFSVWIGKSPKVRKRRPLEGYSRDQAEAILAAVDTSTDTGKRDAAVIQILSSTGIRSCDVASLDLADIDWHANEIGVVQEKTGVANAVPLETEAGEAVAAYILQARRDCDCDSVFLAATGATRPISSQSVSSIVRKYSLKACPEFDGKRGAHSFRRGLGAGMVEAGVALSDVANALGQAGPNSAQPYTAVATERLRACCAGLGRVPVRKGVRHGDA